MKSEARDKLDIPKERSADRVTLTLKFRAFVQN